MAGLVGLPFVNGGLTCDVYASGDEQGCVALYRVWVVVFAMGAVPLSLLGIREQATYQVGGKGRGEMVAPPPQIPPLSPPIQGGDDYCARVCRADDDWDGSDGIT